MTIISLLAGISIPPLLVAAQRARGSAAARHLAGRMALARTQAISRSRIMALYFEQGARGVQVSVVQDGNRNGVLAREIAAEIDRTIEPAVPLSDLFPGVEIAVGPSTPATQAVQLSGTNILSFTPDGTATSGSVYVLGADGTQWVVRVLGVTGRVRVLRFVPATGAWVNVL